MKVELASGEHYTQQYVGDAGIEFATLVARNAEKLFRSTGVSLSIHLTAGSHEIEAGSVSQTTDISMESATAVLQEKG